MSSISITAFYHFATLSKDALSEIQSLLLTFGKENGMRGLVLLAPEGINGTVCADPEVIASWKDLVNQCMNTGVTFKDSSADELVFPRFFVKIKEEIVGLHQEDIAPQGEHQHITPEEWNTMTEEEDAVVLDTRNDYEVAVGKFEGAIDPKLKSFHEFPEYVKNCGIPKEKKVLMYCTGGIRCEKALLEMEKQGYKHVYQLKGGILQYLQECPEQKFEGECFVFDNRITVDQHLQPSKQYGRCPHCGDPAEEVITCDHCQLSRKICAQCETKGIRACSKDCRHKLMTRKG
jgi:UPF0176 protein